MDKGTTFSLNIQGYREGGEEALLMPPGSWLADYILCPILSPPTVHFSLKLAGRSPGLIASLGPSVI